MQRLEVSGAVRPIYGSLGFKRLRADALSSSDCVVLNDMTVNNVCVKAMNGADHDII